ncbi:MAG: polyamine aminopropyltransferase [Chloroflexi bacterium]|nr:polyamine aminopropyltransferase [Chloroflexota bacterium]
MPVQVQQGKEAFSESMYSAADRVQVSKRERATLLVSVLIIAICALTYELIVGTLSSYLLGDSITQFSLTIGLFLFAMGIGALLSRRINKNEVRWFILVEVFIGVFGGFSAAILYAVFATTTVYYYTVMIGLIVVIGACIGLEIPLLTRIVATRNDLSKALADVLSFDYLGSLVAALAFPLLLLPVLGVTQTAFLMGLFNLIVAGTILYTFRNRLPRRATNGMFGLVGFFTLTMTAGLIFSNPIFDFFEQQLYEQHIIYREQSRYQRIIITRHQDDVRLFLDGNLQFSSRDEYRYHELLAHPVMSAARSHEAVLVLGGGDGFVPRELLKYEDVERIVVVDLDPAMTDLARENPLLTDINGDALDDPRVEIINQDAFRYVQESSDLFNVIIIDLPDPNNESISKLYSEQFYRFLHDRLTPDGAFVTQATSPYFVRQAFWSIAHTIEAADYEILPLHTYVPSFGEWGFVIAAPSIPPQVSVPEDIELRYLTPEVLTAAQVFDPDIADIDADVSTLDDPVVSRYYIQGWRRWD